jgi:hypothetical protein
MGEGGAYVRFGQIKFSRVAASITLKTGIKLPPLLPLLPERLPCKSDL